MTVVSSFLSEFLQLLLTLPKGLFGKLDGPLKRDKKQEERGGRMACNIKSRWNQSRNVETVFMSQVKISQFIFQKNRHKVFLNPPFGSYSSSFHQLGSINERWMSVHSLSCTNIFYEFWLLIYCFGSSEQHKSVALVRMRANSKKKKCASKTVSSGLWLMCPGGICQELGEVLRTEDTSLPKSWWHK